MNNHVLEFSSRIGRIELPGMIEARVVVVYRGIVARVLVAVDRVMVAYVVVDPCDCSAHANGARDSSARANGARDSSTRANGAKDSGARANGEKDSSVHEESCVRVSCRKLFMAVYPQQTVLKTLELHVTVLDTCFHCT